jgi:hypothetical protein
VKRSPWEPKPGNREENRRIPSRRELRYFRAHSDMTYKRRVSGRYRGSTDEIIQWAAHKHGIDEDVMRAVAVKESWWRMSTIGDNGDSFGLFQIRRPYHCCPHLARYSTAFNADYYGAIIRAYYDGRETWLNDVTHGEPYRAGDLWGSIGAWFSGRWHTRAAEGYIADVRRILSERTWRQPDFRDPPAADDAARHTNILCLNSAGTRYFVRYRPRTCAHFGPGGAFAGGVNLKRIRWRSWNRASVTGRARECGFHLPCSNIRVRIRAYRRRHACGRLVYTRLSVRSSLGTTVVRLVRCPRPA